MNAKARCSVTVLVAGASLLCVCTTIGLAAKPVFVSIYIGNVATATMKLEMLKELPQSPREGWLNSAEQSTADGRYSAVRRGPIRFELKPTFVAFQTEKVGAHPSARFYWEGDSLVICMLNMTVGTDGDSGKIALLGDYDLCATMQRKAK
jgi:hypothetical protein